MLCWLRIDHPRAGVASNFAEVRVLTQVHHRGRIHDAAVVTVSEGRDVALTHVLDDFGRLRRQPGGLAFGVGQPRVPPEPLGFTAGQVVTTALCQQRRLLRFQQFVCKHATALTAISSRKPENRRTGGIRSGCRYQAADAERRSGHKRPKVRPVRGIGRPAPHRRWPCPDDAVADVPESVAGVRGIPPVCSGSCSDPVGSSIRPFG